MSSAAPWLACVRGEVIDWSARALTDTQLVAAVTSLLATHVSHKERCRLRVLRLGDNCLTGHGIRWLCEHVIPSLPKLRILDVSQHPRLDQERGLDAICDLLRTNTSIQELDLTCTGLSNETYSCLRSVLDTNNYSLLLLGTAGNRYDSASLDQAVGRGSVSASLRRNGYLRLRTVAPLLSNLFLPRDDPSASWRPPLRLWVVDSILRAGCYECFHHLSSSPPTITQEKRIATSSLQDDDPSYDGLNTVCPPTATISSAAKIVC